MGYEMPKQNNDDQKKSEQLDINFPEFNSDFESERNEIAKKYKVPDPTKIFKDQDDNVWKFIDTRESVIEWDEKMQKLDEKENNDIYHHN